MLVVLHFEATIFRQEGLGNVLALLQCEIKLYFSDLLLLLHPNEYKQSFKKAVFSETAHVLKKKSLLFNSTESEIKDVQRSKEPKPKAEQKKNVKMVNFIFFLNKINMGSSSCCVKILLKEYKLLA